MKIKIMKRSKSKMRSKRRTPLAVGLNPTLNLHPAHNLLPNLNLHLTLSFFRPLAAYSRIIGFTSRRPPNDAGAKVLSWFTRGGGRPSRSREST